MYTSIVSNIVEKGRIPFLAAATLLIMPLVASCGTSGATVTGDSGGSQPVESPVFASYLNAASIPDLVANSAVVAIVTATGDYESREVPGRTSEGKPDPRFTSVYGIYEVTAETYLKGAGPGSFKFAQVEKTIFHNLDRPNARTATYVSPQGPLADGTTYMLFLQPFDDMYVPTYLEPARWRLAEGVAKPESPSEASERLFAQRSESELLAEVAGAVAAGN